jgi:hypothetical protein
VVLNQRPATETATAVVEDKAKPSSKKNLADKKGTKDSWFSVSSSPWEGEIQKASQLASTWDAPATNQPATPKNGAEKTFEVSEETKAVIEEAALPRAAVEAIREEAALVTEGAEFELETDASAEGSSYYAKEEEGVLEPNSPSPTAATPPTAAAAPTAGPNMDDLVAKVLAKMNPEVLQAVTREILKPVVEAMVKEELKSKKP